MYVEFLLLLLSMLFFYRGVYELYICYRGDVAEWARHDAPEP